jgi:hypothetical protein
MLEELIARLQGLPLEEEKLRQEALLSAAAQQAAWPCLLCQHSRVEYLPRLPTDAALMFASVQCRKNRLPEGVHFANPEEQQNVGVCPSYELDW